MPGYPILDRDKRNLEDKFLCEYCQSVLRDATRASCGHYFCSSCVKHLFLNNPREVCSRTGIPLFHYEAPEIDVSFCNKVNNLAVHCLFLDVGCQWNGRLHDFEGHVANCDFGSCKEKEMGQAQGYERCTQLEASGGEECDVVVKTTNNHAEHLCGLRNERVHLNAMKLHQSEECQGSAKTGKRGKGGIPQKEQLNVTQLFQRQVPRLLSSNVASKIKYCRENSLEFKDEIAPTSKEVAPGNSDTRNTSSRNSITVRLEQRLNDLENRVAQDHLLIMEIPLLWQNIHDLFDAFRDVSNKVDVVQRAFDCQKREFDAFHETLNALKNEQINLQARFNRLLESPLQHGELARLNRNMEVIQERIARLERYSRSHGRMLANMTNTLTALADEVRRVEALGVDIQRL